MKMTFGAIYVSDISNTTSSVVWYQLNADNF